MLGEAPSSDRERTFQRALHAVIPTVLVIALGMSSVARAQEVPTDSGWTITRMDVDVVLRPEEETLRTSGVMTLRLDAESSMGPRLSLNTRHPILEFVSVEGADVASVELNVSDAERAAVRYARIELLKPARRGDEVQLRFACSGAGKGYQIRIDPDVATASWTDAWYPFPHDDAGRSLSQLMSAAMNATG